MGTSRRKLLMKMQRNPQGDWTIEDIETVCRQANVTCTPPTGGGSHYKISHPNVEEILTIVARRPVKVIYVKKLLAFIEEAGEGK